MLTIFEMFFALIGAGILCYGLAYTVILCFVDCDLRLAFAEKFGKSVRRMKGQVVFITGASSGIGENLAIALARHGVKLVLTARRWDELNRVKQNCINASGGQLTDSDILIIQMDVTDMASHQQCFDQALRHFSYVDILVNNAGRSQRATWENIDVAVDKQMFELNVFATLNLSRIFVRYFNTRGAGRIAVTSSITGIVGCPFSATYTGSKHALHGYYNCLRAEKVGKGIGVTIFCPGPTLTNFLENSFTDKEGQRYGVQAQAAGRMTGVRCGELCAAALANKLDEVWMGVFPMMPFCYMAVYFPLIYTLLLKTFGPERLYKFRDSKEETLTEAKKL